MFTTLPSSKMGDSTQEVLATASSARSRTAPASEPPDGPGLAVDALLEPWLSCLQEWLGELRIFDCHTHLGCADPDGSCFEVDELLDALAAVDGRAVVFPLAEPGGYRAANDRRLAAAARLTAGHPAEEYLELARLACELPADHPDAPVATSVRELLDRHARYLATDPSRRGPRVPGIHLIFVAAAIAHTPGLP